MCLIAFSTWMLSQFTPEVDVVTVMIAVFIQGAGFGFLSVSIMTLAFQSMPTSLRPDGTSVLSLFRRLGSSIGVSVLVAQLARSTQSARSSLSENISVYNDLFRDYPLPESWSLEQLNGVVSLNQMIEKQAEFIAYLHDFRLMTVLMLILLPLVLILRNPKKKGDMPIE